MACSQFLLPSSPPGTSVIEMREYALGIVRQVDKGNRVSLQTGLFCIHISTAVNWLTLIWYSPFWAVQPNSNGNAIAVNYRERKKHIKYHNQTYGIFGQKWRPFSASSCGTEAILTLMCERHSFYTWHRTGYKGFAVINHAVSICFWWQLHNNRELVTLRRILDRRPFHSNNLWPTQPIEQSVFWPSSMTPNLLWISRFFSVFISER